MRKSIRKHRKELCIVLTEKHNNFLVFQTVLGHHCLYGRG